MAQQSSRRAGVSRPPSAATSRARRSASRRGMPRHTCRAAAASRRDRPRPSSALAAAAAAAARPPRRPAAHQVDHQGDLAAHGASGPGVRAGDGIALAELQQRAAHDLLVDLGELAAYGGARVGQSAASTARLRASRCPVSKATTRPPHAPPRRERRLQLARAARQVADEAEPVARRYPAATSAVSTADGPGSTVMSSPSATTLRTRRMPGSCTPGIPASVTSATSCRRAAAAAPPRSSAPRCAGRGS